AETTRQSTNRSSGTTRTNRTSRSTAGRSTSARRTTQATKAPAAKSTGTARRRSAATKRSTTAKKAAATRAANQSQRNASRAAQGPKNRVEAVQQYAERAALVQVGAALEARDRVVSTVNDVVELVTTPAKAERQLKKFERRGTTARNRAQREVRKTRNRVQRELRQRRTRLERTVKQNVGADIQPKALRNNVAANVDLVAAQVENAVQTGITAGTKLVQGATERASA
ncbi:MAG TPA: hypothetical protein VGI54_11225, partial [Solirubrobacteraceae bacterium]